MCKNEREGECSRQEQKIRYALWMPDHTGKSKLNEIVVNQTSLKNENNTQFISELICIQIPNSAMSNKK